MKAQIVRLFCNLELPTLVDGLLSKFLGEERFSSPRFQEKLPVLRAMYHGSKVSSRRLVVLITETGYPVHRVMEEMEVLHLLPATYADLLYFVSHYRDKVDGPIMAFGTKIYQQEEVYEVPTADGGLGDGTEKLFYLTKIGKEAAFGGGWGYLAYPKPQAELPAPTSK